jgi:polar amino acid transport system substrate-binding protein
MPGGGTLGFAFDQDSFPTQYGLPDGASAGVYPAIVAALCRQAGIAGANAPMPFRRVVTGYGAGTVAAGAFVKTPERLALGLFTQPYFVERLRPYVLRGGAAPVRSVADLKGMRVGVIRGWAYGQEFDEARSAGSFRAEEVAMGFQNFQKLQRGRLDCVIETELAAALFMPALNGEQKIEVGDFSLIQAPIHIAIPKRIEQAEALVARLDKALAELVSGKALQQIVERELRVAKEQMPAWLRERRLAGD